MSLLVIVGLAAALALVCLLIVAIVALVTGRSRRE